MEVLQKQYEYVSRLSPNIKQAIIDYTDSSYEILNRRLRNDEDLGGEYTDIVSRLDQAFSGVPPTESPIW